MGRSIAVVWHASFSIAAGVLYFFFTLPRWPELLGDTSFTLGMAMRIVAGALIGLAALPVVFTLLRTRRPEYGTPQLALTLRTASIVLHVLAGVLIIGAAISEIWLSLDDAGRWLFGIYGAAAAIAVLGVFAFYLAFVAELPPPPPKPLKSKEKKGKQRRRKKGKQTEEAATTQEDAAEPADDPDTPQEGDATSDDSEEEPAEAGEDGSQPAEDTADEIDTGEQADTDDSAAASDDTEDSAESDATLGNRRPSGKASPFRRRRRLRGGVAVEE